ncbi:MAG: peptidylprolyl isomerase [Acidimicrobiales bacterium]
MSTEKRQRQKAGRQARREAEAKAHKRKQRVKRVITLAIVALVIAGIVTLASGGSSKHTASHPTTSTKVPTTTTVPAPKGGSGNTSPSAITTSANCPTSFTATLNKPSYASYPPMTINPSKTYTATITTDVGPFTVRLDAKAAPKAVNSFVFLADHHFFDCITFHRVIPGFVDQTGDPTGTGSGGPGYQFTERGPAKATPQYPLGSVAMANSNSPATTDPTTNGSQFFVVAGPQGENLAPNYTLFGKVISGMSVVEKINSGGSATGVPPTVLHRMISVTIAVS